MRKSRYSNRQRLLRGEMLASTTTQQSEAAAQKPVEERTVAEHYLAAMGCSMESVLAGRTSVTSDPGRTCRQMIDAAATLLQHAEAVLGDREQRLWELRYLTADMIREVLQGL